MKPTSLCRSQALGFTSGMSQRVVQEPESSPELHCPDTPPDLPLKWYPQPATSIPSHLSRQPMDLSSKPSWSRRNPSTTPLGNERRESASDPPPYYLHDVKSPGNVTFIDPWNSRVPPAHASAIEHNEISPATSMSPPPHRSHNNSDDLDRKSVV